MHAKQIAAKKSPCYHWRAEVGKFAYFANRVNRITPDLMTIYTALMKNAACGVRRLILRSVFLVSFSDKLFIGVTDTAVTIGEPAVHFQI